MKRTVVVFVDFNAVRYCTRLVESDTDYSEEVLLQLPDITDISCCPQFDHTQCPDKQ